MGALDAAHRPLTRTNYLARGGTDRRSCREDASSFSIRIGKACAKARCMRCGYSTVWQPGEPGIDRGRLRRMTAPTVADSVWRVLIDELVQEGRVQQSGHWLHFPEHRVTLSDRERELGQKLQSALAAGQFDPPWVRDLALAVRAETTRCGWCCANAQCRARCIRSCGTCFTTAMPLARWLEHCVRWRRNRASSRLPSTAI